MAHNGLGVGRGALSTDALAQAAERAGPCGQIVAILHVGAADVARLAARLGLERQEGADVLRALSAIFLAHRDHQQ